MRFGLLGPLSLDGPEGPIEIASYKQRSLLALLLVNANQIVPTDRIIDALWGEESATPRQNALWVHVSNLRKVLGGGENDESIVLTRQPGYLVQTEPGTLDVEEFEKAVRHGRELLSSDPAMASILLGEALGTWRGHALEDFLYEEWAQPEITRLCELRLEAVEARIDADLARGLARELIGELETLVTQHPLREPFTGQWMLALFRAGRQSDALRAYGHLRARLADELGIDPSAELQRLEEQILTADPALDATALLPWRGLEPGLAVRGYELRAKLGSGRHGAVYRAFQPAVGREVAVRVISAELANDADFIRNFEAEARLVAGLEHPHVVPLYDYWREPDAAYLVTRYMGGGSLADVIDDGWLDEPEIVQMAAQVGGALAAAHEHGMVHADVRPSNVLLDDAGNGYLTDFEIAGDAETMAAHDGDYVAPERREGEPATPASDVYGLGRLLQDSGQLSQPVQLVLDQATRVEPSQRFADAGQMLTALARAAGDPTASPDLDAANPFKGLRAFDQHDAHLFFGRERMVERLVARLGGKGKFLVVVGPSGSGKSSVVKAGLIPALRAGALPRSESWFIADMTPGRYPTEMLADALESVAVEQPIGLVDRLLADHRGLVDVGREMLSNDGGQLVLVVDQFEELFTHADPAEADHFIELLTTAVTHPHCPIRVVVTVRADYSDRPLNHPEMGRLMRDSTELISPMTTEELERAIQGPAQQAGVTFEAALVAQIIADVAGEPGGLPLLQYTLTELFEARRGSVIHTAAYSGLGGVTAALANRADSVLRSLDEAARRTARQIFLRLVTLGEGAGDSRRRVRQTDLTDLGTGAAVRAVLDTFGRHRLLTFDRDPVTREPTVEIAHEALLRDWPALRRWIDETRDDLRIAAGLDRSVTEWVEANRDPAYLLQGRRLAQASEFADHTEIAVRPVVQEFIDESTTVVTTATERRRRVRRRITSGFAIAAVVASVLAALAFIGQQRARDNAELARSRELAAAATGVLDEDPELSLLLAVQAASTGELEFESRSALRAAMAEHRTIHTFNWDRPRDWTLTASMSPDASLVAVGAFDSEIEVWDVSGPDPVFLWDLVVPHGWFLVPLFTADGSELSVVTEWGAEPGRDLPPEPADPSIWGVHFYDPTSGEHLRHLTALPNGDCAPAPTPVQTHFHDRGTKPSMEIPWLAIGPCENEMPAFWRVDPYSGAAVSEPRPLTPAVGRDFGITTSGWAFVAENGVLHLENLITGVTRDVDFADRLTSPFLSPAGSFLIGQSALFDAETGEELWAYMPADFVLTSINHPCMDLTFNSDESRVFVHCDNGDIRVHETASGRLITTLRGHDGWAFSLSTDRSGSHVISGSTDGTARLWDLDAPRGQMSFPISRGYNADAGLDVAGDRAVLLTYPNETSNPFSNIVSVMDRFSPAEAIVFDTATGVELIRIPEVAGKVARFSPDGQVIAVQTATDSGLGAVRLFDADSGVAGLTMEGHCDFTPTRWVPFVPGPPCAEGTLPAGATDLAWSPDGELLAMSGGTTNRLFVWNAATGASVFISEPLGFWPASAVQFSPDGELLVMSSKTGMWAYSTRDWSLVQQVGHPGAPSWVMRFTPEGRELVTAQAHHGQIRIYDAETWEERDILTGSGQTRDLALTEDGTRAALVNADGLMHVVDLASGEILETYPLPGSDLTNVEFLDDQHLLVTDRFGPVEVLTLDTDELIAKARTRVSRGFTEQECETYRLDPCPTLDDLRSA